jgi:hypothetical protein
MANATVTTATHTEDEMPPLEDIKDDQVFHAGDGKVFIDKLGLGKTYYGHVSVTCGTCNTQHDDRGCPKCISVKQNEDSPPKLDLSYIGVLSTLRTTKAITRSGLQSFLDNASDFVKKSIPSDGLNLRFYTDIAWPADDPTGISEHISFLDDCNKLADKMLCQGVLINSKTVSYTIENCGDHWRPTYSFDVHVPPRAAL